MSSILLFKQISKMINDGKRNFNISVWACWLFLGIVYEIYECALISGAFYQQESNGSGTILL